jgi:hypothetical protein
MSHGHQHSWPLQQGEGEGWKGRPTFQCLGIELGIDALPVVINRLYSE